MRKQAYGPQKVAQGNLSKIHIFKNAILFLTTYFFKIFLPKFNIRNKDATDNYGFEPNWLK